MDSRVLANLGGCGQFHPMPSVDPEVSAIVDEFMARVRTGRAVTALEIMLNKGFVTTDDLKARGYEHPPRAIADIRDNGIPVTTENAVSGTGKRMASYRLGTAEQIRVGQTGRTNFSKKFRNALFDAHGTKDAITGAEHDRNALQIDHRVPYRVSGDAGLGDVSAFMLLDGKSQRAKSWSCEHCENFIRLRKPEICRSCFWASPESYSHVALQEIRRAELVWQGEEVHDFERIKEAAASQGLSPAELLKDLGRRETEL